MENDADRYSGWSLGGRDRAYIRAMMPFWKIIYEHYFRVKTAGWDQIPEGQVLIVGSHNGGLAAPDMHMMMYDWFRQFGVDRSVYGLMHRQVSLVMPQLAKMAVRTGAVHAHPRMAQAAFNAGASVLVYPGGAVDVFRPHRMRDRICLNENLGFIKLALRWNVPIVPAISWGAHDTLLVLEDLYPLVKQLHDWGMPWLAGIDPIVFPVYLGFPWGLAIGPFPNIPVPAQIHTRVLKPIVFQDYGRKASLDRAYVTTCYKRVQSEMQQGLDQLKQEIQG
jgi:1-acyl-sn-glycerol-3-phosphate acyltransferase